MKIEVTQEHIDKGKRGSLSCCPIALAIRERGFEHVCVGTFLCQFGDGNHARLPIEARDFVDRFDSERPVKPFGFDLTT